MKDETLILIVEDNEANQMLATAVLSREGWQIVVVSSALEARVVLSGRVPDLILMDIQLPGQDGLTFTRELKADPFTAGVPVVALTALAMPGDSERSIDAGCVGYISKPINTRTFANEVRNFLPRAV